MAEARYPLGLVVAMPAEGRAVRLGGVGADVRVAVSGIGPQRAGAAAERLLADGARALASWGVAGATAAELRAGDLLVPHELVDGVGQQQRIDAAWRDRLVGALGDQYVVRDGRLASLPVPLSTPADKRERAARGLVAVDMESAAVAAIAAGAGVPFVAIKAICDTFNQAIPACATAFADPSLAQRARGVAMLVGGGPHVWRELATLRRQYATACATLAAAAPIALRILPP